MTEEELHLSAVHHVVHDYANLVSAGVTIPTCPPPPLNTHLQHAFILNCRKLVHFFHDPRDGKDIVAADFFPLKGKPRFRFPAWKQWGKAMDKQIAHLSYERVTNPKPWDGYKENALFLEELQNAWKIFLRELPAPYKTEFEKKIIERQQPYEDGRESEFKSLDLN
jgi:hypothetical protein